MIHNGIIVDKDPYFTIDPQTRTITNKSTDKRNIIQFDHNSERFTFSLPRYIENHDMTECDVVQVHYANVDSSTMEQVLGVYNVDDVAVDKTDNSMITLSWLLSQNTTQRVGKLEFLVRFVCTDGNGNVEYAWNTAIFKGITITEGMNNTDVIEAEYPDVLASLLSHLRDVDIHLKQVDCHAGAKGYYYSFVDLTNKKIYLSTEQVLPQLGEGVIDATFATPTYEIGNGISIVNSNKYDYLGRCTATIKSISNNVIEYDGDVGFTKIYDCGTPNLDDYTLYVPDQPEIGIVDVREGAIATGDRTSATGSFAVALNREGGAHGNYSLTSGRGCRANYCADAGGYKTKANGQYAFTRGSNTEANGDNSSAVGKGTNATAPEQKVHGRYNIIDTLKKFAHIVGNGTSNSKRSNAHTLDWEGNGWFANDVQFGNISLKELIPPQIHSRFFRGKKLGNAYTSEQQSAVEAGTFDDLFVGDYWEIDGIKWRIVDIDYWYGTGHSLETPHHLVVMPDTYLARSVMNDTYSTEGGYMGSKIYTKILPNIGTEINAKFGGRVWGHEEYLVNEVDNGKPTNREFVTSLVDLPSEIMMYGARIWSFCNDGSEDLALGTYCNTQLALFNLIPYYIQPSRNPNYNTYWLRDTASVGGWAYVDPMGRACRASAQVEEGIRPVFALY